MKITNKVVKATFFTGGNGGISARISLPPSWLRTLKVTEVEREVNISFDEKNERIIVEKKK